MSTATIDAGPIASRLPDGWHWTRLDDVSDLNPRRPPIERAPDTATTFIPMSAVAEKGRGIQSPEIRPYAEVAKGYTYFAEGNVIFAKITPCMQNGKHAVARNLIDGFGFGSTEFHVIRPREEVTADWLHWFLIQPWVLRDATAHFTGAVGQQRVPQSFLADLSIPLPPLPEQRRIAALLSEQMGAVERARAAAEAQIEEINRLPAALLRRAFSAEV